MNFTEEKLNISRIAYDIDGVKLEGLIFKPEGVGTFPGVIFIHGHRSSAWESSLFGYFLANSGFAAFLPSQMGYGLSQGSPDFCGPKTVNGIIRGIEIFLEQDFVDSTKTGIWGISRGATVAALVAIRKPELFRAVVFQSGAYEMKRNFETTRIEAIKENIIKEAGTTEEAFKNRSPIYEMNEISFPVLILHGEKDDRISVEQAGLLDEKLTELNKKHMTVILPEKNHFITKETRLTYTFPFLEKYLKRQ